MKQIFNLNSSHSLMRKSVYYQNPKGQPTSIPTNRPAYFQQKASSFLRATSVIFTLSYWHDLKISFNAGFRFDIRSYNFSQTNLGNSIKKNFKKFSISLLLTSFLIGKSFPSRHTTSVQRL